MDTVQKQRELIEKLVKCNNKFSGNEDLFEDFCSETFKRSYSLFETLDEDHLESYISKVVNTAILTVLRESGRVRRRDNKYVSTNEVPLSPAPAAKEEETPEISAQVSLTPLETEPASSSSLVLYDIADPRASFEEKLVRKDLLQKVVDIVLVAQKNQPEKEFLKIFYLRYVREMKQKQIAQETNLSQSEVSKRLLDIAEIVKNHFAGN